MKGSTGISKGFLMGARTLKAQWSDRQHLMSLRDTLVPVVYFVSVIRNQSCTDEGADQMHLVFTAECKNLWFCSVVWFQMMRKRRVSTHAELWLGQWLGAGGPPTNAFLSLKHRLVGLVVKGSVSRAEDLGFDYHLCFGDFSGLSHTSQWP